MNQILERLTVTYPGLLTPGSWVTPEGKIRIDKMTEKHIKNTINMLINKSSLSLIKLKESADNHYTRHGEEDSYYKNCLEAIELIEDKIREFETYLENGNYDLYY